MNREVALAVAKILGEIYPDNVRVWLEPYGENMTEFYVHAAFDDKELVIPNIESLAEEIVGWKMGGEISITLVRE